MGSITRYAAINTKLRALEGRLLSKEDYTNIISAKTINDVVDYLKNNTSYSLVLKDTNPKDLDIDKNYCQL